MSTTTRSARVSPRNVPSQRPGPAGGARDKNRRERVATIAGAGLALYLERGVDGVTVDELVAAAGVAKGSFYRYFRDQEQLVAALIEPLATRFDQAMRRCERALAAAPDAAALPAIYLTLAADMWQPVPGQRRALRLYLRECRGAAVGARRPIVTLAAAVERHAVHITKVARDRGLLREVDPRVVALLVVGAVERLLLAALSGTRLGPVTEVARTLVSVIVDGVRAPSAPA
jgi:AcrR family transcriptional regulator